MKKSANAVESRGERFVDLKILAVHSLKSTQLKALL